MLKKLAAVVLAGLSLVCLMVFTGQAAASDEIFASNVLENAVFSEEKIG